MLLQTLGIVLVLALVLTLFIRPGATVAVLLALGVVGASVFVSWDDVQQARAQRAANVALQQQGAKVQPNVTVPPPAPTHSGS